MADKTVTQLTELTAVDDADIMMIVDDPSGTPISKKVTVSNVLLAAYQCASATPIYTDVLGFVDDPAGTAVMASATLQAIAKAGASQGAISALVDTALTASRVLVSDGTGKVSASSITATTLAFLDATSSIQTQLNGKEPTITTLTVAKGGTNSGTALNNDRIMISDGGKIVEFDAITAARALISNADGIPVHSVITSTELGYLDNVSSNIQTQLDSKITTAGYTTSNAAGSTGKYTKIASVDLTAQYQACAFTLNVIGYNEGTVDQFEMAQVAVRVNQGAAMASAPDVNVEVCNNKILNSSNFHAVITTNSASHTIVNIYIKYTKDYQGYTFVPLTSAGTGTNTFYSSQSIDTNLPAGTKEGSALVIPPQFSRLAQQVLIDKIKANVTASTNIERLIFFDATGASTTLIDRMGVANAALGQAAHLTEAGMSECSRTLRFDGSTTYFEFNDATDLSPLADGHVFSVVACVKPRAVGVQQQILAKADYTTASPAREWEFYLDSSNKLTTKLFDETTDGYKTIASTNDVSYDLNNWNCYAFGYNGYADMETYRNGQYWNDAGYVTSGTFTTVHNLAAKVGNYRTSTAGAKEQISNMEYSCILIINEHLSQAQHLAISNAMLLYVGNDIASV
jgi:hypothetical protein